MDGNTETHKWTGEKFLWACCWLKSGPSMLTSDYGSLAVSTGHEPCTKQTTCSKPTSPFSSFKPQRPIGHIANHARQYRQAPLRAYV